MNDPVGVLHHRGRYHLFYQHHPHSTVWDVACSWGHATGRDLVRWRHLPPALEPGDGDDGCWSGSTVVRDGHPVIVYTSVSRSGAAVGRVRLAEALDDGDPDLRAWRKQPCPEVEEPHVRVAQLRDPYVWADGDRWRMLLGAGLDDGTPAVLGYSSSDLARWSYDGVVADGRAADAAVDLGQLWECPQLLQVDGFPVLVVSVWRDHVLSGVLAAVGSCEDGAFRPTSWRPLVIGAGAYAATTFRDAEGRACSIAWLRSEPTRPTSEPDEAAAVSGWAGVLTLPVVLSADADGVRAAPHGDVDALLGEVLHDGSFVGGVELPSADGCLDLRLTASEAPRDVVLGTGDGVDVVLRIGADGVRLPAGEVVPSRGGGPVRLLVDVGVVEVFPPGGGWGAARTPGLPVTRVTGDVDGELRGIRWPA